MRKFSLAFALLFLTSFASADSVTAEVNWPKFMERHDLVWEKLPRKWEEAPYLGNGNLGSMLYIDEKGNRLRLQVFRVDVQDHRDPNYGWAAYSRPRLMIGSFYLQLAGKITGGDWRQDLWNAEVSGSIETEKGAVHFSHLVHTHDMVMQTMLSYEGGEKSARWTWEPHPAETTRPGYPRKKEDVERFAKRYGDHYRKSLKPYQANPPVEISQKDGIHLSTQSLLAGGQYAVAWKLDRSTGDDSTENFTISIEKSYPESTASISTP